MNLPVRTLTFCKRKKGRENCYVVSFPGFCKCFLLKLFDLINMKFLIEMSKLKLMKT